MTLIVVDFPAFDRPAKAISGSPAPGNCESFAAEVKNLAEENKLKAIGESSLKKLTTKLHGIDKATPEADFTCVKDSTLPWGWRPLWCWET